LKKHWDDWEETDKAPSREPDSSEAAKISEALSQHDSNISRAAQSLGIDRSTLYRKMRNYQIEIKKIY